jgi:hypothetical protein
MGGTSLFRLMLKKPLAEATIDRLPACGPF